MAAKAPRRALVGLTAALLALGGCGGTSEGGISGGGKVIGRTVTVYSLTSDPSGTKRDFVDAEKLALSDAGARAGSLSVNFASLDLGTDERLQAQAAKRAISDPQIIAAIADANTVTVPLLNAAGLLQVAPGGDASLVGDPQALPSGQRTVGSLPALAAPADFERRFRDAFGRDPSPGAERGYRAMQGVLRAIGEAGAAGNDRARVVDAYLG
jgi:ABC-type glycerol-3-phosphate transport system substrate-binding protein